MEVDIDKILPVTEARDNFNKIVDEVVGSDSMYVLTKNGKPSAVIVGVNHLEKLTGKTADELTSIVEKKADETPVVEEVKPADSLGDNVAGGSKPLETDVAVTGQSIQPDTTAETSPIDVPVDIEDVAPTTSVATPMPQMPSSPPPNVAPTSPTQAIPSDSGQTSTGSGSDSLGVQSPNVASNQSSGATPATNDSDLFV